MKILIMTDSMFIPTGLGRVGKELALGLGKRGHQIGYIGWWHREDIFPNAPYNIQFYPTRNKYYGSDVLDQVVNRFQPEALLTVGDFWWLSYITDPAICRTRKFFQWCGYIPVDGEPISGGIPPGLVSHIEDVDIPVAYTEYAKRAVLKSTSDQETRNRIRVIYHGVDTNVFKPLSKEERGAMRRQFKLDDKFLFLTVCRNQSRKNLPELFRAWKIFSELPETKGKVVLWPHTHFDDPMGWKIDDLFAILKLRNRSIMYYNQVAHAPSEQHLIPDIELARLYQIADAFVLLSGEGFGLPIFEAMASRVPCILTDYAASSELGANGRAELIPVNGSVTWTGMHLTQRPVPNVDQVIESMLKIYKNRSHREAIAHRGHEFAVQHTWDKVLDDWHSLMLSHEVPFIKPLTLEVVS